MTRDSCGVVLMWGCDGNLLESRDFNKLCLVTDALGRVPVLVRRTLR